MRLPSAGRKLVLSELPFPHPAAGRSADLQPRAYAQTGKTSSNRRTLSIPPPIPLHVSIHTVQSGTRTASLLPASMGRFLLIPKFCHSDIECVSHDFRITDAYRACASHCFLLQVSGPFAQSFIARFVVFGYQVHIFPRSPQFKAHAFRNVSHVVRRFMNIGLCSLQINF